MLHLKFSINVKLKNVISGLVELFLTLFYSDIRLSEVQINDRFSYNSVHSLSKQAKADSTVTLLT
jgi:hypothetical protein